MTKQGMTKTNSTMKRLLLAPVVYSAAMLLMFEDWLWNACATLGSHFTGLRALRKIEEVLVGLSPRLALCAYVMPAVLLFPVKLLALFAMARGHVSLGIVVILVAKLLGTALVARIYSLTKPALLSMPWFARWHNRFVVHKDRLILRLKTSPAWRHLRAELKRMSERRRYLWLRLRKRYFTGRFGRLCRKLIARKRARKQR